MPAITINVNTGTFVQGGGPRRSPRLARAGTVRVVPRLTVFTTSDAPVVPSRRRTSPRLVAYYAEREAKRSRHAAVLQLIDDVLAVAAMQRPLLVEQLQPRAPQFPAGATTSTSSESKPRTSPRLAGYYAKRQAVAKQKEVMFRLIKEVLAVANSPKVVTPPASEAETKIAKAKNIRAWADTILPLISRRGGKVTVSEVVELLTVIYDHPMTLIALRTEPRLGVVLRRKIEEFRAHPTATPSLRLLCDAVKGILQSS